MYTLPRTYRSKTIEKRKKEAIRLLDAHTFIPYTEICEAVNTMNREIMNISPAELKHALFPKERLYDRVIYAVKEELDTGKTDKTTDIYLFSDYKKAKTFFEKEKKDLKSLMDTLSNEWKTDDDSETHFIAEDNCYEKYGEISISKMQIY